MCRAVSIDYQQDLKYFFTEAEVKDFENKGEIVFAYWDKYPMIPFNNKNGITFIEWGNRASNLKIPRIGWTRLESLLQKKWGHIKSKVVLIPAKKGCEKKR